MSGPRFVPLQIPRWFQIANQTLDSEYIDIVYSTNKLYLVGTTLEQSVSFTISGTTIIKPITASKSAFIVCLDADTGTYVWHSWILGSGDQTPVSIALTNSDTELVVCGVSTTTDTTSFTISNESVPKPATSGVSAFTINVSVTDGSYSWSKWIYGSGDDYIRQVNVGNDGSIYVFGDSTTTSTSITICDAVVTKPATTASAAFLVKMDSTGTYVWNQWLYGDANAFARSFTIDTVSGDFYVCGDTIVTGTSFIISGTTGTKPATTFSSGYVCRLAATDGTYVWDSWIYNSLNTFASAILNDSGTLYISGRSNESTTTFYVSGTAIQKPATLNYSGFLIKLNTSGGYVGNTWLSGSVDDYIQKLKLYSSILFIMGSSSTTGTTFEMNSEVIAKPATLNSAAYVFALDKENLQYLYGVWIDGTANEYNRNLAIENDKIYFAGISNSNETDLMEGEYTVTKADTSSVFGYASMYQLDMHYLMRNATVRNGVAANVRMLKVFCQGGTTPGKGFAILTTTAITSITGYNAISGGTIISDGGRAIITRGVCWNTTGNPTIADSKTSNGSGIGSFTSNISGLSPTTTYYVRAYATNSAGTAYGNQLAFDTTSGLAVPLDLWLDASDSSTFTLNGTSIQQWRDKSGNNRHASQSTLSFMPTLVSNAVSFDGSQQYFDINLDWLAGVSHSAFIVIQNQTYTNIYGAATGGSGANSLHVGFNSSSQYRMNYWGNDFYQNISANYKVGQYNLLNFDWINNTSKTVRANTIIEGTENQQGIISTMSGGGRIINVVGQGHMQCQIREIIFITGANITSSNRSQIETFLINKWGL